MSVPLIPVRGSEFVRLVWPPNPAPRKPIDATVAITTLNRSDELLRAVRSACEQEGCEIEVIVLDGGSSDDSAERVHEEFPQVTVYRSNKLLNLSSSKNLIANFGHGGFMFGLDDDAEFLDPHTVVRTIADFDAGPDIGAVAIPYRVPTGTGNFLRLQHANGRGVQIVDTFIGCAYAVRRELFVKLGGFWEIPNREERDFCMRLLQAGYLVRLGTAPEVEHRPSAIRDHHEMAFTGPQGEVEFALRHAPASSLPWHLARTTGNLVLSLFLIGGGRYTRDFLRGFATGLRSGSRAQRRPVDPDIYRLCMRLRRRGPLNIEAVRLVMRNRHARPERLSHD
jgi:glycosyltransferase involved in cell wall biosynthesis